MLQAKEIFQSAAKKLSWKSYLYSFLKRKCGRKLKLKLIPRKTL